MSTFGVVTHFRSFGDIEAPCGRLHGAWHGCCVRAKRTPVRIALFCPSYGQVGGIEEKARILIEAFRAQGHAVTVLARGEPATSGSDGDVPVVRREYHQMPRRARHVVSENARVGLFVSASRRRDLARMGELFLESHQSLQHEPRRVSPATATGPTTTTAGTGAPRDRPSPRRSSGSGSA